MVDSGHLITKKLVIMRKQINGDNYILPAAVVMGLRNKPNLDRLHLERGHFREMGSVDEEYRSSTYTESPGSILELQAEVCEGDLVNSTDEMGDSGRLQKSSPAPHLSPSRGRPRVCLTLNTEETKICLPFWCSLSLDTTQISEWQVVSGTTPYRAAKESKIDHSRMASASKIQFIPLCSYTFKLTLKRKWNYFQHHKTIEENQYSTLKSEY